MKLRLCTALCLSLGLTAAMPATAEPWIRAESAHFIIYSEVGVSETRDFAQNLEKFRYLLTVFLGGIDPEADRKKLPVYFARKHQEFKQFKLTSSDDIMGFACFNMAGGPAIFAAYDTEPASKGKKAISAQESDSQAVLYDLYANYFLSKKGASALPYWFREGFSEYFAPTRIGDDNALVGMAWEMRAYRLDSHKVIHVANIVDPEVHSKLSGEDAQAQEWLLVHYIYSSPENRKKFAAYLDLMGKGTPSLQAFETAFGATEPQLDSSLHSYLRDKVEATYYSIKGMPQTSIDVSAPQDMSSALVLWRGRLDGGYDGSPDDMLANVGAAVAHPAPDDAVELTQGLAFVSAKGREAEAVAPLGAYIAAHPDEARPRFYLGLAYYRAALHHTPLPGETDDTAMAKARTAFALSYQRDPDDASAMYFLSLASHNRPDFPDDNAVNSAINATVMAPDNFCYLLEAVRVLIVKDRIDEARGLLATVPEDYPPTRVWLSRLTADMDAKAGHAQLIADLDTPIAPTKAAK